MRALAILLVVWSVAPARAQGVLAAIRADDWVRAEALVAADPDPLAGKLVRYYRLLAPGGARAAELAAFMLDSPDWPQQALLSRRLQEALAADKDDRAVLELCRTRPPTAVPSLLRCAEADERAGVPAEAPARRAWIAGVTDAPAEAAFLRRWGGLLTADDQWRRFERLAWTDSAPNGPAARQVARLAPGPRAAAEARLALRRDQPTAPALVAGLPEALRTEPTTVLELARWYRRAGQDRDAAQVWTTVGEAAEAGVAANRRRAFWDERNLLARRLLRFNEPVLAYQVAALPAAGGEAAMDAEFLAGWLALRRVGRPADALAHFKRLAALSPAAITQARAHYWLGRTRAALGEEAAAEYREAARWGTTYYGQLAARALGEAPVLRAADPDWSGDQALAFLAQEPAARAAVMLAAWGDARRAKPFLQRLDETAEGPVERAMAARLALELGLPEQSVAIARRAGSSGVMLPEAGWPAIAVPAGEVEPAVVLGLIRQESSFDVQAQSPVGARGLMQLMPATAAGVARKLGLVPNVPALTSDADYNVRLGSVYLADLLARFDRMLPLALAGYNAGPSRVVDWLAANPTAPSDVGDGADDMIDWIEQIPFTETRNYVQRVIENIVMYRAQLGAVAPHPVEPRRG